MRKSSEGMGQGQNSRTCLLLELRVTDVATPLSPKGPGCSVGLGKPWRSKAPNYHGYQEGKGWLGGTLNRPDVVTLETGMKHH